MVECIQDCRSDPGQDGGRESAGRGGPLALELVATAYSCRQFFECCQLCVSAQGPDCS